MAPEVDVCYDGSRIFSWVSDLSGLPLDQVSRIQYRKCEGVCSSNFVLVNCFHKNAPFLC
jgi:hypothetical protein